MAKKLLKRTNMNITEEEYNLLVKEVKEKGLSMSDIIRRALDKYFKDKNR
jgi:predicted CopG family antitoxin